MQRSNQAGDGNLHNMSCCTLNVFDKVDTGHMHLVERLHLQQLPSELNLAEVIHAFPHKILVIRIDP